MEDCLANIASAIADVLSKFDVLEAYVFGSYARGDQTPESDIDLRLVCGDDITFGDLLSITEQLEDRLQIPVELVTNPLDKMRPRFREQVLRDEVQLYEAA